MKPFKPEEVEVRVANFMAMSVARKTLQKELSSRGNDVASLAEEAVKKKREADRALAAQREAEEALRRLNTELEDRVAGVDRFDRFSQDRSKPISMGYHGGASGAGFVGTVPGPSTHNGYWLLSNDGAVFSFGDAQYHGGAN